VTDPTAMLVAKDAIRELTARYCTAVIEGDGASLAGMFTQDGEMAVAGREPYRGRAQIGTFISGLGRRNLLPLIHNHVIAVAPEGNAASGTCIVQSPISPAGGGGFVARYEDSYVREAGEWRFAQRRIEYLHTESQGN